MDLTFEVDTNLDLPAVINKSNVIETIITDMALTDDVENIYGWDFDDIVRTYYTPHKSEILIKNNREVILKPGAYENWYKLFNAYGMKYDMSKNDTYLHCRYDGKEMIGVVHIDIHDNMKLIWNLDTASLPEMNLKNVDAVIDPHNYEPNNVQGERYLIVSSLGKTNLWGQIKDINGNNLDSIDSNCIIEYNGNNWVLMTDPSQNPAVYYVQNNDDDSYLTWNDEYQEWHDVVNGIYREGFWRLSQD